MNKTEAQLLKNIENKRKIYSDSIEEYSRAQEELSEYRLEAISKVKWYDGMPVIVEENNTKYNMFLSFIDNDGAAHCYTYGATKHTTQYGTTGFKTWMPDYNAKSLFNFRPVNEMIPGSDLWLIKNIKGHIFTIYEDKDYILTNYQNCECLPIYRVGR